MSNTMRDLIDNIDTLKSASTYTNDEEIICSIMSNASNNSLGRITMGDELILVTQNRTLLSIQAINYHGAKIICFCGTVDNINYKFWLNQSSIDGFGKFREIMVSIPRMTSSEIMDMIKP